MNAKRAKPKEKPSRAGRLCVDVGAERQRRIRESADANDRYIREEVEMLVDDGFRFRESMLAMKDASG